MPWVEDPVSKRFIFRQGECFNLPQHNIMRKEHGNNISTTNLTFTRSELDQLIAISKEIKINSKEIRDNPGNCYEATMANALAAFGLMCILDLVDMDEEYE